VKDAELEQMLKYLRLPCLHGEWARIIEEADRKHPSYTRFLKDVVAREYHLKRERSRLLRLKKAQIPSVLVMETYPFEKQPKLNKRQCMELYDSKAYLTDQQNIALIGPTGTGKTGLATAYLVHAINSGYTGRFILFADLIDELFQAVADHSEKRVIKRYLQYDCLLIDELGYEEVDSQMQAGLVFRLLRQRKRCTIVTSNLGFDEWPKFLKNQNLAAALIDKFTANCHLINMLRCRSITPRAIPPA
jgi:DNA replication protein DnaC